MFTAVGKAVVNQAEDSGSIPDQGMFGIYVPRPGIFVPDASVKRRTERKHTTLPLPL